MTQHNPNLSLNQQGKDVALLHSRLINIGYTIDTPEIIGEIFGQSTYQAVLHFQRREGLRPTGVVDDLTAQALVNRFESDKTVLFSRQPAPPSAQQSIQPPVPTPPPTPAPSQGQAQDHPLFQADPLKVAVASLLRTSPTLGLNQQLQADFIDLYATFRGPIQNFWNQLTARPEFQAAVPELKFTLQLSDLLSGNVLLISLLRQQFHPTQLQDLISLTREHWTHLLNTPVDGQPIAIPSSISGTTREQQVTNYVTLLMQQLQSTFPTTYLARNLATQPAVNVSLVHAVLNANPGLNPAKPLPAKVNWGGVDQQQATTAMNALRQEMNAFPTANYQDWLATTTFTNQVRQWTATVLSWIASNGLDIRTASIDVDHVSALQQAPANLQAQVVVQLSSLQRLSRLTLDYSVMYTLQSNGKHSAFSVAQMPQGSFLNQYSALLGGRAQAQIIYANAISIFAQVTNLRMRIGEALNGVSPKVLGNVASGTQGVLQNSSQGGVPNWTTLFGSPGACQCRECQSVYGAAAYFVDLMQFLKNSGGHAQGPTALAVLQKRRPDLWYLKLDCANTETELPFVDLVNEVLESYVYYVGMLGGASLPKASNNTPGDATSDELGVNPEYTNQALSAARTAVYAPNGPLAKAIFPFTLPFQRFLETARVYFKDLNITLEQVMRAFRSNGQPSNLAIACECLGISPEELPIIDGTSSSTLAEFYGFPAGTPEATLITTTNPYLGLVQNFMQATGLAYADVLNLLSTRFLNPGQQVTLSSSPTDPCDLTQMTFQNLYTTWVGSGNPPVVAPGFLAKAYRFIRLWRKTGWTMSDLDKALTALGVSDTVIAPGGNTISDGVLQAVAQVDWLRETLNLTITQLLCFWSNIDVDGRDSLYVRLFQNRAFINPVDLAFQLVYSAPLVSLPSALPATWSDGTPTTWFNGTVTSPTIFFDSTNQLLHFTGTMTEEQRDDLLAWAGSDAAANLAVLQLFQQRSFPGTDVVIPAGQTQQPPISANVNTILAALQVSAHDLTAIAVDAGIIPSTGSVTLAVLSTFYRYAILSRALGLSVTDFISLKTLTGINPFQQASTDPITDPLVQFVKAAQMVSSSNFSVAQLNYLYRALPDPADNLPPLQANQEQVLIGLSSGLQAIAAANEFVPDPNGTALGKALAKMLPADQIDSTLNLIKGSAVYTAPLAALPVELARQATQIPFLTTLVTFGGVFTPGDAIELTLTSSSLPGTQVSLAHAVIGGDSAVSVAANLHSLINSNATLAGAGVSSTVDGAIITLSTPFALNPFQAWTAKAPSSSGAGRATEKVTLVDSALNRLVYLTNVTINGTVTVGDWVTLTLTSAGIAGSPFSLQHQATSGDSPSSIAADLTALINNNATMNAAGLSATATGPVITIASRLLIDSSLVLAASATPASPMPSELVTITGSAPTYTVTLGGTVTAGDTLALTIALNGGSGSVVHISASPAAGDSLSSLATNLSNQINANLILQTAGLSAAVSGSATVTVTVAPSLSPPPLLTAGTTPAPPLASELVTISGSAPTYTVAIGGTVTAGDTVTFNAATANAAATVTYLVAAQDSLSSIATNLGNQINANPTLQAAGISAVLLAGSTSFTVSVPSSLNPQPVLTVSASPVPPAATEQVTITGTVPTYLVAVSGTATPGDRVALTFALNGVSGSPLSLVYPVASGDLPNSIAAGLSALINTNPTLNAAGISATVTGALITVSAAPCLAPPQAWAVSATPAAATETPTVAGVGIACSGPMSDATRKNLLALASAGDTAFIAAVENLSNQVQDILSQNLQFLAPGTHYAVPLSSLPAGLQLPSVPPGQVSFVADATVEGMVTPGDQLSLTLTSSAVSSTPVTLPPYAVTTFDTPFSVAAHLASQINANATLAAAGISAAVSGNIIRFSMPGSLNLYPVWSATLTPATATETITFFTGLVCSGPMTNANRVQLQALSSDAGFAAAVDQLYNLAWTLSTQQLIDLNFPGTLADRYDFVFEKLLAFFRLTQSESLVKQALTQSLGIDASLVALLLQGDPAAGVAALLPSQSVPTLPAMSDFLGGLLAFYYSDASFKQLSQYQIDPGVDLDGTEPAFGSAQWFGQIVPPTTDTYTFSVAIPSGSYTAQVFVNGQNCSQTPQISLQTGRMYDLQVSVSSTTATPGQPVIQLQWSNSKRSLQTIPTTALVLGAAPASAQGGQASPAFIRGGAYSTLSLLNRIALLVSGFSMQAGEVEYLSAHSSDFQGVDPGNSTNSVPFDLSILPLDYFPALASGDSLNPLQGNLDLRSPAFLNQWQRLNNLYLLKKSLQSNGNVGLFAIFQAAADSTTPAQLTIANTILQATGWNAKEFSILAGSQTASGYQVQIGFGLTDANFKNEISLVQLAACLALASRVGVSSQQLFLWANLEPDATQAQNIQTTVKAKYDETTWLQVGKSLNNKLRSSSRDALIAYLLSQAAGLGMTIDGGPITTADQLYEFFLIDVQMGTCMETSRIVQANAAIQQFVQRCLLGLESQLDANGNQVGVEPSWIDSTVWAWMHNYRLWEANREVFLYPENYIVPTLRDDMTPPFRDLMDSLLQNPITDENVTQAYQEYLYALNDVSQLQICGTFWENHTPVKTAVGAATGADNQDSGVISTLHVFGRTTSTQTQSSGSATNPQPQYYYRRVSLTLDYQTEGLTVGTWTPWERVDPQIPGNHLIPVVWAGRLYLFWPTFSQTSVASAQSTTVSGAVAPAASANDLLIGLSWSEYRQGSWTGAQSSPYSLPPTAFNPFSGNAVIDYSQFIFYAITLEPDGNLLVGVMDVEQTGPNELQNPNFVADGSTNAPPWTWNGAPDTVSFTTVPGEVSISSDSLMRNSPNITSESIPVAPGQTWTASIFVDKVRFFWPYPDSAHPGQLPYVLTAVITIQFFGSSGGIIVGSLHSNQMTVTCQILPTNQPPYYTDQAVNQVLQVSGTAPAGAATIHMQVIVQSQRDNGALYFFSSPSLSQDIQPGLGDFIVSFTPQANSSSTAFYTNTAIQCPVKGAQFSYMWIQGSGPLSFGQPQVPPFITDPGQYQLTFPQDQLFDLLSTQTPWYPANPFFLSDSQRAYFVVTTSMYGRLLVGNKTKQGPPYWVTGQILDFSEHWHPFTASFIQTLNWFGVPGLLTLANQCLSHDGGVLSGLELSVPSSVLATAPDLSSGILAAQGQPVAFYNPTLPAMPGNSVSYLYFNRSPNNAFYYAQTKSPANPGDAFIGTVNSTNGMSVSGPSVFEQNYQPSLWVQPPYPLENVDFSPSGAYSIYNWELFCHIPFLVATQLSQNQQFQDAKTWFEYLFNPTSSSSAQEPQRFWNFLPFAVDTEPGRIQVLLSLLQYTGTDPQMLAEKNQLLNQIQAYINDPFNPFAIARLRPLAFMKTTVMAYLDNLIAWGDSLFSQNTRESINEATQLYVLAQDILGPRPQIIQQPGPVQNLTYNDVQSQLDALSNPIVQLENAFHLSSSGQPHPQSSGIAANASLATTYFCIPANDQLLAYWDTIDDRLYKIRHCMNIQGQVEQLPLFASPINPAVLVAATAAGVDLSSVLGDMNAPAPNYRFAVMLQKALELCAEVRSLGGSLLAALEKHDSEKLSLLHATQETQVLQQVMKLKVQQVNEANANVAALNDSKAVTILRQQYYQGLISKGLSEFETGQTIALGLSQAFKNLSQVTEQGGSALSLIPQFEIGVSGISSPVSTITMGGQQLSTLASMVAKSYEAMADNFSVAATLSSLLGQWDRRLQEWNFQAQTATAELTQITDQINAAGIRVAIATLDQQNQQTQINNAQAAQDFLTKKFTNQQLYSWMVGQISRVYFQAYQMAYELARRAEFCFRFELGLQTSNFIRFGYWDSLKKGLLCGESLYADLKSMEIAYLDQNNREYEITRNISLVLFDPIALIALKETGQCLLNLPEAFFDMDYPGHYMRRMKSISLTIPCVTGPYTSVNCTLTLTQSKIRCDSTLRPSYEEKPAGSDPRFLYNFAPTQSIATSTAQNDSGLFEVNFRDDRYLPFEGLGVISQWMISMPPDCNAFDFETISDVILHLKYTSREGGAALRDAARKSAVMPMPQRQTPQIDQPASYPSKQNNLFRYFSLKHEFPTEWYRFMNPQPGSTVQAMSFFLTNERFPFQYRGKKISISQVQLVLQFKAVYPLLVNSSLTPLADYGSSSLPVWLAPPSVTLTAANGSLATSAGVVGVPCGSIPFSPPAAISAIAAGQLVPWSLTINSSDIKGLAANLQVASTAGGGPFLNPVVIDDLFFVCQYSVQ